MHTPNTAEIDIYSTAENLVNNFNAGIALISEAYGMLENAEKLLSKSVRYAATLPDGYTTTVHKNDLLRVTEKNQKQAWRYIIQKMHLRSFFSSKRYAEVEKQIEDGKAPELTVENIHALVDDITGNMTDFLKESVKEVFEWALPGWSTDYKTNKKSKIGKKIIKEWMVENWCGNFSIHYRKKQELVSLDNAMHLLDGKGPTKELTENNLVTKIETTMRDDYFKTCETEYFSVKWFKNGNMHIEFKRPDLLTELNRIGAGGKPNIGPNE